MSDDKKSGTTAKVEDMQKEIDELKEQSKPMADRIWNSIPLNLRNGVLLFIVGIGGLGGGGFLGLNANESDPQVLKVLYEIQTEQKVMANTMEAVQEDVKTNTQDIKTLLSK